MHPANLSKGTRDVASNWSRSWCLADPGSAIVPGEVRRGDEAPADLILKVGRIWTGDPEQPWAEALAVRSGEVVAVGPAERGRAVPEGRRPASSTFPAPSRRPGLVDAHAHLIELGANQEEVDLRGASSPEEVARRVKARIDAKSGRRLDLRRQLGPEPLAGRRLPDLGAARQGRARTGRSGSGGSTAMPAGPTPRRCGGPRCRRTRRSHPTARSSGTRTAGRPAIFIDGAMDLIYSAMPGAVRGNIARRILAAQAIVLRAGPDRHPRRQRLARGRGRGVPDTSTARGSSSSGSTRWPAVDPAARSISSPGPPPLEAGRAGSR